MHRQVNREEGRANQRNDCTVPNLYHQRVIPLFMFPRQRMKEATKTLYLLTELHGRSIEPGIGLGDFRSLSEICETQISSLVNEHGHRFCADNPTATNASGSHSDCRLLVDPVFQLPSNDSGHIKGFVSYGHGECTGNA